MENRSYLKYLLHAAVLLGLVVAAVKYLNGEEVLTALSEFAYVYMPFMLALSTAYMALKAWRFVVLMRPVTDQPWSNIFRGFMAGQAMTLLPAGVAARTGLMRQLGVPIAKSTPPVIFSSALDQVIFVAGTLIGALWFEGARQPAVILLAVLVAVALLFYIPVTRAWLSNAARSLAERFKIRQHWQHFLTALRDVASTEVLLTSLTMTAVAFGLQIVLLDLSLRGLGMSLPYPTLFLVYFLPTMLGRLFPIPGGVGVTEAGMVGFLVSAVQIDPNTATAAVAIFRVVSILWQAVLGAVVYFFFWRGEEEVATDVTS